MSDNATLETTAEVRKRWADYSTQYETLYTWPNSVVRRLCSDLNRSLARIAELEAENSECGEELAAANERIAELEAANAALAQLVGRYRTDNSALKAERDRLKAALDMDDVLTELMPAKANANFRDGWVSGQRAFREAIRARAALSDPSVNK